MPWHKRVTLFWLWHHMKFFVPFCSWGGATNQLMILQLCHIGIKAVLTNSLNMLFRYESINIAVAYLNCYTPPLRKRMQTNVSLNHIAVKQWLNYDHSVMAWICNCNLFMYILIKTINKIDLTRDTYQQAPLVQCNKGKLSVWVRNMCEFCIFQSKIKRPW